MHGLHCAAAVYKYKTSENTNASISLIQPTSTTCWTSEIICSSSINFCTCTLTRLQWQARSNDQPRIPW